MRLLYSVLALSFTIAHTCFSQYDSFPRFIVNELANHKMKGRGYVEGGLDSAANFIQHQYRSIGLLQFNTSYKQEFEHPVNTFPEPISIKIDDKELVAGVDYLINPYSKGLVGEFQIKKVNSKAEIKRSSNKNALLLSDETAFKNVFSTLKGSDKLIITTQKKLTWSASLSEHGFTHIIISDSVLQKNISEKVNVNINNKYYHSFLSNNLIGYVRGTQTPDSFIVFSAHYDHLGMMGKVCFNGANDNASGIALLLNLAHHYSKHPHKYSIVFIAFAGEELGLLGSQYFVKNPSFALSKIKFLINMDIVGTGEEGIKVVNSTVHPNEFSLLQNINKERLLLKTIAERGPAANSDHYHFTLKNVPAFFMYTLGGIDAYHDINDRPETLPLDHIPQLTELLTTFVNKLTGL